MRRLAPLLLIAALSSGALVADVREVKLTLPVTPEIELNGEQSVAVAPFVIATTAEEDQPNRRAATIDIQREFQRFLSKEIARESNAAVTIIEEARLPGRDTRSLVADSGFWRGLARRYGADLILTGIIDFDIEDKVGYRTEEFTSPIDGRTYYRQVLVESTGFVFDIVFLAFDGETGEKLIEQSFRDFKEFRGRNFDEIAGLFENLRSLETKILGLFVQQEIASSRYLFKP